MDYIIRDLIDIAVQIEQDGAVFYENLSQQAANESARAIFLKLADDERKHREIFLDMRESESGRDKAPADSEIELVIQEIERSGILPESSPNKIQKIHPLNAIKLGIKAEKRTVKFYRHLSGKLKNPSSRKMLKRLIDEEKRHVVQLTELHKDKTFTF